MASIVQKILNRLKQYQDKQQYKTSYLFEDEILLNRIIEKNRSSLAHIAKWYDDEMLANSIFRYGITDNIISKLSLPIDNERTYSDAICYFSNKLKEKPVSYLEIGVSIGKNFYQLLNYFQNAQLVAYEIEEINPYLSSKLQQTEREEWPTKEGSIKKNPSSKTSFIYQTNKVDYMSADIWDENSWAKLAGRKFNIIFSDALHDPDALLFEYEMIRKYDLLDKSGFLMIWDDLGEGMTTSFLKIKKKLSESNGIKRKNTFIIRINGWIGQYWDKHPVGMITNL